MRKILIAAAVAGAALLTVSGPADARRVGHGWHGNHAWHGGWRHGWRGHRGWGWGWGAGAGFAAGALVGSALAAPYYYGGPGYYAYEPGGGSVAYCMRRFRSYDPQSGTYLGYDGERHPCP
jgi:hypothetical protein